MSDFPNPKIFYIIGENQKAQKVSASLNRVESIKKGFDLVNAHSEIILVSIKTDKNVLFGKIRAFVYVFYKLLKSRRGDIFIFYGSLPYYVLLPLFKKKLRFVVERNEFPTYLIKHDGVEIKKKREDFLLNYLKYFDGLITCSQALSSYYSSYLRSNASILICPLVIDIEKFSHNYKANNCPENYFAYCGRLGNNKDGVPILIESFAALAAEIDSVKLYIIGNASESVESELKAKALSFGMGERIIFTGAILHNELIPILQNAQLLLLARPNNKQAEGGIPSKIGEYMAVKVPMVLTKVGELDNFLTDNINCFMAEPNSVISFKNKMIEAYYSSDKELIAQNAFETVQQFDIKNQAQFISEFCKKLKIQH